MGIRTAILGYGRSGSTMHAGAVERNADFEMAAACDTDADRRKEAEERFGCPVYDDYHEMLNREQLDLVCVITRSDQHCAMTCDCLEAGVNVLVTKPWAVNAAEAERMVQTAQRTGKKLFPWLPARWGSDLRRLQKLMSEKAIGDVFLVRRAVACFGSRNDWQTERRFGGGYLLNWGPHIVDPPLVLIGSPVRSVFAQMRQTINPGDVEDVFLATLTLADGTIVVVEHTVSAINPPGWFIQGTRGTITVSGKNLSMCKKTPPKPSDPTQYAAMQSQKAEMVDEVLEGSLYGDEHEVYAELAAALRDEREFAVPPEDALQLSRVLDAIRTSSDKNRAVNMDSVTSDRKDRTG